MNLPFDLIIFDMDGVLIDSERLSCGALRTALARHGVQLHLDEVYARFLGRSFAAVVDHFRLLTGRDLPANFRSELREDLFATYQLELAPMTGATEILARLRQPYCIASSSDADRIALSLRLTGLAAYFGDHVFNAAMVAHGKPAPDLFLHAAATMRIAPERALVIEDSVNGILAGKAAGMTVWGFTGGSHYDGTDAAPILAGVGADRVIGSMADLLSLSLEEQPR